MYFFDKFRVMCYAKSGTVLAVPLLNEIMRISTCLKFFHPRLEKLFDPRRSSGQPNMGGRQVVLTAILLYQRSCLCQCRRKTLDKAALISSIQLGEQVSNIPFGFHRIPIAGGSGSVRYCFHPGVRLFKLCHTLFIQPVDAFGEHLPNRSFFAAIVVTQGFCNSHFCKRLNVMVGQGAGSHPAKGLRQLPPCFLHLQKLRNRNLSAAQVCTAHYIRECVLDEVILEDLRWVTAMVSEHTREFAEYIGSRQSAEIQREIRRQERELTAMRKRGAELDAIFKRLYEDRVLGHLSVEQFQALSGSYTEEQEKLTTEIPAKESAIQKLRDAVSSTEGFIAKAKRYTDITELMPELLRLFIQKIVVHEKSTKWSKKAMQTIEIHYNDIGCIGGDIPQDKESPRQEISA